MGEVFNLESSGLEVVDIFSNGRVAYEIPFTEKRVKISSLCNKDTYSLIFVDEFLAGVAGFDVELFQGREDFCRSYCCREWAFDNVGLNKYGSSFDSLEWEKLPRANLSDVVYSPVPVESGIVMYLHGLGIAHWGIMSGVGEDVVVDSKWGGKDVFRHSLKDVSGVYGDSVMFFGKR